MPGCVTEVLVSSL